MRATRRSPTTSGGFLVDLKRVTFRYRPEGLNRTACARQRDGETA